MNEITAQAIRDAIEVIRTTQTSPYVRMIDLRTMCDAVLIDETLVAMMIAGEIELLPESNQKVLTEDDHASAVWAGNQWKHLVR